MNLIEAGAEFSPDGLHRYRLWRRWGDGRLLYVIGLNPSTADAQHNDPTVRRCIGFAERWGFDGLMMLNLFAFRATDPIQMRKACDAIGPRNINTLSEQCQTALALGSGILCAWGSHGSYLGMGERVRNGFELGGVPAACFGLTKNGQPLHPLYIRSEALVVPFTGDGGRLIGATSEAPF